MGDQVQRDHGGEWTRLKLDCIEEYLRAYNVALKFQDFHRIYIDAFSGTGEPYQIKSSLPATAQTFFEVSPEIEPQQVEFFQGSVRRALGIKDGFHSFKLIESKKKNVEKLKKLKEEPDNANKDIEIIHGDANRSLLNICASIDWHGKRHPAGKRHRAVLFLDPFGCQVDWSTIQAVARTRAIDMWYLFPTSAIIRQVPKNREIPAAWKACLDRCLGPTEWMNAFYEESPIGSLFDFLPNNKDRVVSFKAIEDFLVKQLSNEFYSVNNTCLPIDNMQGSQLYSLCFAAANKAGSVPAMRIAGDLIRKWTGRRR